MGNYCETVANIYNSTENIEFSKTIIPPVEADQDGKNELINKLNTVYMTPRMKTIENKN